MKNIKDWKPTKIIKRHKNFFVNPFGNHISSYFITLEWFNILKTKKNYFSGKLFDLGCGDVPLFEFYRENVEEVTCIDWKNTLHKQVHIDNYVNLNRTLDFRNNCADTILLSSVLEHISNPFLLFSEIARILKPCGSAIVTVPFLYQLHETPHDYFRYTKHGLAMIAQKNKLEIVSIETYGNALGVIVDVCSKIFFKIIHGFINYIFFFLPKKAKGALHRLVDFHLLIAQWVAFKTLNFRIFRAALKKIACSQIMPLGYVAVFKKPSQ